MTRRPYESPRRRQQTEETRRRIVDAGCALVERHRAWEWREVTFRAVAAETGISERTVYRYFASDEDLHAAVMTRLAERSGASTTLSSLDDIVGNVVRFVSWYARHVAPADSGITGAPAGPEIALRRPLSEVVEAATAKWEAADRIAAAAVLDVLTDVRVYEPLMRSWGMSPDETTAAVAWLLDLVVGAIQGDRSPSAAGRTHPVAAALTRGKQDGQS